MSWSPGRFASYGHITAQEGSKWNKEMKKKKQVGQPRVEVKLSDV